MEAKWHAEYTDYSQAQSMTRVLFIYAQHKTLSFDRAFSNSTHVVGRDSILLLACVAPLPRKIDGWMKKILISRWKEKNKLIADYRWRQPWRKNDTVLTDSLA